MARLNGKQTALMPGNEDKVGYWLTPPDLMADLQAEFDFDFDACPYPRPAGFDGLKEPWGKRTWCNPPFNRSSGIGMTAWARKAVTEAADGKMVVFIGPVRQFFAELLRAGAEVRFVGPVDWETSDGRPITSAKGGHAQNQVIFILRPKP